MKILHIHPSLAGGGIEAMICGLVNEMAKTEDVTVCSIFEPKEDDIFWNKLDSSVKRISLGKLKEGFSVKEILKIFRLLVNGKYDVVNLHGFFYYYAFSVLLLHHRIKFFYTVHSDAYMENSSWDKHFFLLKKRFFQWKWLHPITISQASKDSFTLLYGIESRLIYNGIPQVRVLVQNLTDRYRLSPNTKIFIHAGRISKEKNQFILCKIFKYLIEHKEDVVLLIAGRIRNRVLFESLIPFFSERIIYIGERDNIPQLMAHCDAMCLPSVWEGLPVTLLESLSAGCIPICSPVGGIPNVIADGINGFLSKSSDENDYILAIKRYLALSTDERSVIKENCVKSFDKYDIRNTSKNYLNYYKEKLEQ